VVRGELLGGRRLPHDRVAHERGRGRQVARDGGEVERGDRGDEPVERPVVEPVPHPGAGLGLLLDDPARVGDVEPPEVDQLAGAVDLGLLRGLGLAEDRRGVDRVAPGTGQQVGGTQQHGGTLVERQVTPGGGGLLRGGDGVRDVLAGGLPGHAEDVLVVVRLDDVDGVAARHPPLPADGHRELVPLTLQLGDPALQ
jgi:hypothetical protein